MTVDEVRQRVEEIRLDAAAGDDESAHGMEDQLRDDVLAAIADGTVSPSQEPRLAREALATSNIEFERWCS